MSKRSLIRYEGQCTGSLIWRATNTNKSLIQNHSFWEIGNGEEAYFFKDSWQQLPKFQLDEHQDQWINQLEIEGITKVKDFWAEDNSNIGFRVWKSEEWFTAHIPAGVGKGLHQELQKRRIENRESADQLRWGYGNSRNFNIKEAAGIVRGDKNSQAEKKWT